MSRDRHGPGHVGHGPLTASENRPNLVEHRNHYVAQTVSTASPAHLVTMLYDRLLVGIRRARAEFEGEGPADTQICHDELVRCQRIVEELRFGLDDEKGGEIAASLRQLYDYCHGILVTVNMTKAPDGLSDVEQIISELREVWYEQVDKGTVLSDA